MHKIDITKRITDSIPDNRQAWEGSKHEKWFSLASASKGKIGTLAYADLLRSKGLEVKIISSEGDLEYKEAGSQKKTKVEVKTSKADVSKLKNGEHRFDLWFNQIRPKQKGWKEIVLVGVFPNHVRIWQKSRKEWDSTFSALESVSIGHRGSEDLMEVRLRKNTNTNNLNEWKEIYNDQEGKAL